MEYQFCTTGLAEGWYLGFCESPINFSLLITSSTFKLISFFYFNFSLFSLPKILENIFKIIIYIQRKRYRDTISLDLLKQTHIFHEFLKLGQELKKREKITRQTLLGWCPSIQSGVYVVKRFPLLLRFFILIFWQIS